MNFFDCMCLLHVCIVCVPVYMCMYVCDSRLHVQLLALISDQWPTTWIELKGGFIHVVYVIYTYGTHSSGTDATNKLPTDNKMVGIIWSSFLSNHNFYVLWFLIVGGLKRDIPMKM